MGQQGSKTKFLNEMLEECEFIGFCDKEHEYNNCSNADYVNCPIYQDKIQAKHIPRMDSMVIQYKKTSPSSLQLSLFSDEELELVKKGDDY